MDALLAATVIPPLPSKRELCCVWADKSSNAAAADPGTGTPTAGDVAGSRALLSILAAGAGEGPLAVCWSQGVGSWGAGEDMLVELANGGERGREELWHGDLMKIQVPENVEVQKVLWLGVG